MAITGLHHIDLRTPDPAQTCAFAWDFGLHHVEETGSGKIYLRGAGTGAYQVTLEQGDASALAGLAFSVDSRADLEKAVSDLQASPITPLDGPGGGEGVTLFDPDGNRVHLVFGIADRSHDDLPPDMIFNQAKARMRRGEVQSQRAVGPPDLLRLGHVGLFVRDYQASDAWYRGVLGLLPSDLMYAGATDNLIAGFYRIDQGDEWVDHHTVALFGFGKSELHHMSFEVQNAEAQFVGHRWLLRQGREPIWGVGRHPKGSHVFDVWRSPGGFRFETFSDTDVSNAATPVGINDITTMEMDLWTDRSHHAYFE